MIQKHPLLKSTAILTCAGMVSRIIGFFYRIFLSKTIGAEGIGIYLLLFPIQTLLFSLTSSGIQTAISRCIAANLSRQKLFLRTGLMISLFFLAITAPGFCLNKIVGLLKERTKAYSLLSIALGLLLIWIAPLEWLIIPGCLLVGLGYGVIQPMLYEKTTHAALPQKATMALAFVMMMNYLAILLYPFIGDFLQWVFHTQSQEFPFIFNLLITVGTFFWAYRCRDTFLFNDQLK